MRRFDISPFGKGGIHKFTIYLLWGLNLSLFLGPNFDEIFKFNSASSINSSYDYLKLKKNDLKSVADLTHSQEFENNNLFGIIPPCNCLTSYNDVISNFITRGPPHNSNI